MANFLCALLLMAGAIQTSSALPALIDGGLLHWDADNRIYAPPPINVKVSN